MATGALDTNGIWQYGEDDSETTFSGLLNKLGSSTSTALAAVKFEPFLIAAKTSNTTLNSSTYTVLTYQSVQASAITQTSSSRFTVTKSGVYLVNARQYVNNTSWGLIRLLVNGSNYGQEQQEPQRSGVSTVEITEVISLDAGYYVEVSARSDGTYPATNGTLSIAMITAR